MSNYRFFPSLLIVPIALTAAAFSAPERKIDRAALPPAVEKTVQQNTGGAVIKGFSTEMEHGRKVYEAETVLNGRTRDLQIAPDGTLSEIEEEVAFDSLPAAVQRSLQARAGAGTIVKVESLTKKGRLVAYEASMRIGNRKGEAQVGPIGETLRHAE